MGARLSALCASCPLFPGRFLVLIYVYIRDRVDIIYDNIMTSIKPLKEINVIKFDIKLLDDDTLME
jgi:hypothetical protein